jgi:hypothetical protein
MTEKNPYSTPAREQHPVEVTKVWPNAVTPSSTPSPVRRRRRHRRSSDVGNAPSESDLRLRTRLAPPQSRERLQRRR